MVGSKLSPTVRQPESQFFESFEYEPFEYESFKSESESEFWSESDNPVVRYFGSVKLQRGFESFESESEFWSESNNTAVRVR